MIWFLLLLVYVFALAALCWIVLNNVGSSVSLTPSLLNILIAYIQV